MVLSPLQALLKSRKFIVALAAILAYLIVLALPDLKPHQGDIATVLLWLAGLVIGGIALEDAGKAVGSGPKTFDTAVRQIVTAILDELLVEDKTDQPTSSLNDPPAQ